MFFFHRAFGSSLGSWRSVGACTALRIEFAWPSMLVWLSLLIFSLVARSVNRSADNSLAHFLHVWAGCGFQLRSWRIWREHEFMDGSVSGASLKTRNPAQAPAHGDEERPSIPPAGATFSNRPPPGPGQRHSRPQLYGLPEERLITGFSLSGNSHF